MDSDQDRIHLNRIAGDPYAGSFEHLLCRQRLGRATRGQFSLPSRGQVPRQQADDPYR